MCFYGNRRLIFCVITDVGDEVSGDVEVERSGKCYEYSKKTNLTESNNQRYINYLNSKKTFKRIIFYI